MSALRLTRAERAARRDSLILALSCARAACELLADLDVRLSHEWGEVGGWVIIAAREHEVILVEESVPESFRSLGDAAHYLGAQLAYALGEAKALDLSTRHIEEAQRAAGYATARARSRGLMQVQPPAGLSLCGRCQRLLIHCRCPAQGADAGEQVRPTGEETALSRHAARMGESVRTREVESCE